MAVVDSYSQSNYDTDWGVTLDDWGDEVGQTFACSADKDLSSVSFYLQKHGSPTGNAYVDIYAHTGTYGSTGVPTGSALATSDAVDVSGVSSSYSMVEFAFSGGDQISLSNGTKYCAVLRHSGGTLSNCLYAGVDESSPSHGGNAINSDGVDYYYEASADLCFSVEGEDAPVSINVNDSISVTDVVTGSVGDLSVSASDTVSVAEDIEFSTGIPFEVSVFDSITVSEDVTGTISTDFFIDVNDSVAVTESVSGELKGDFYIDVNDTVSITEAVTILPIYRIWTDELDNPIAPVSELEASFGYRFELDETAPVSECSGSFGAEADNIAPTSSVEATGTFSTPLVLDKIAPVSEGEGILGSELAVTAPVSDIEAKLYSTYIGLDKKAPVCYCTATAFAVVTLSLDRNAPASLIEATCYPSSLTLSKKAPASYAAEITISGGTSITLDKKAPVGSMLQDDGLLECFSITLDKTAPVGTMSEDTGVGDCDKAIITYEDRFDDFTLEHSR